MTGNRDRHQIGRARARDGSSFDLTYQMDRWPSIKFTEIKAYQAVGA